MSGRSKNYVLAQSENRYANAIGVEVSSSFVRRADRVIEMTMLLAAVH
jgi:hypothetical protein